MAALNLTCKYFEEFTSKFELDEQHLAFDAWSSHLRMFFNAMGIIGEPQMIAILVLQGGEIVSRIYAPLANDTFDIVLERIKQSFKPKNSKAFARFKLNNLKQGKDEPIVTYVEKLKRILKAGEINDPVTIEELLLQTITVNTSSSSLQKFILLSEQAPTVLAVIKEATLRETIECEQKSMKKVTFDNFDVEINAMTNTPLTTNCQMCGLDHNSAICPAASRSCHNCGEVGHFTKKCSYPSQTQRYHTTPPSTSNIQQHSFNSLQNPRFYNHNNPRFQKFSNIYPPNNNNQWSYSRQHIPQPQHHSTIHQLNPMANQSITHTRLQRPMYHNNNLQYSYQQPYNTPQPSASINQIQESYPLVASYNSNSADFNFHDIHIEPFDDAQSFQYSWNEHEQDLSHDYFRNIETNSPKSDSVIKTPTSLVDINGQPINMLLDTGSTANLISAVSFNLIKPLPTLKSYKGIALGYAMSPIRILGQFDATLESKEKKLKSTVLVAEHNYRNILGAADCQKLGLIHIFNVTHDIFSMYPSVFSNTIGKYNKREVRIHIDYDIEPVVQKLRRVCLHQRESIAAELCKMVELDIIEKVPDDEPTTWVNNIRVVVKKDGSLRITMDTKLANLAILTERYVMPTPDDIRFKLNGMSVLSKMDMNRAYQQFVVDPRDRHIMVFATHIGLFRSKRLFFGLKSAAELFQKLVSEVIRDITGALNVSDDILVFGKDQTDHDFSLHQVLKALSDSGLTLSKNKCQFNQESLTFYGMEFSGNGVKPTAERIKAFLDAPPPSTAGEICSILSSVQFSAGFIKNLATIADPLRKLSHEKGKITLTDVHLKALDEIKSLLASNALAHFNVKWDTELETDASPVGLGACLLQRNPNDYNDTRIIENASRTLTEVERKWSHIEKELLAAVFGCKRFHLYIYAHPFELRIDNKPIEQILNNLNSNPSTRMQLLITHLSPYHFRVKHIAGSSNQADYISRNPLGKLDGDFDSSEIEDMFNMIVANVVPKAISNSEMALATKEDEILIEVIKALDNKKALLYSDSKFKAYADIIQEFSLSAQGILIKSDKCVIPKKLQSNILNTAHSGHAGITKTTKLAEETVWFLGMRAQIERFIKHCNCQTIEAKTYRNPLIMTPLPPHVWHSIAADFKGPICGVYLLVIICLYSRYPLVFEVSTTSFRAIAPKLAIVFSQFGMPISIKTDNGPPFNGAEFAMFCADRNISHNKITPYWPNANGTVERFMPGIAKVIKVAEAEGSKWRESLLLFLLNFRATPHSTTGFAPATLFLGRKIKTLLPQTQVIQNLPLDVQVRANDSSKKEAYKEYADLKRSVVSHQFKIGDKVRVRQMKLNSTTTKFDIEVHSISAVSGSMITAKRDVDGHMITRDSSHFVAVSQSTKERHEEEWSTIHRPQINEAQPIHIHPIDNRHYIQNEILPQTPPFSPVPAQLQPRVRVQPNRLNISSFRGNAYN